MDEEINSASLVSSGLVYEDDSVQSMSRSHLSELPSETPDLSTDDVLARITAPFSSTRVDDEIPLEKIAFSDFSDPFLLRICTRYLSRLYDTSSMFALRSNQFSSALADVEKAIELQPRELVYRLHRGIVLACLGAWDESYVEFNAAILDAGDTHVDGALFSTFHDFSLIGLVSKLFVCIMQSEYYFAFALFERVFSQDSSHSLTVLASRRLGEIFLHISEQVSLLMSQNRFIEAIKVLDAKLSLLPRHPFLLFKRGCSRRLVGDYPNAIVDLLESYHTWRGHIDLDEKVRHGNTSSADIEVQKQAEVGLQRQMQFEKARVFALEEGCPIQLSAQHIFLSQLQTLEEDCKVQLGLVLCDMGTELLRARDGLGSLAYFSQSLEWNTSGSTLLLRADNYFELQEFEKAIRDCIQAMEFEETRERAKIQLATIHNHIGTILHNERRYRSALDSFRLASQICPHIWLYWFNVGRSELYMHQPKSALKHLRLAKKLFMHGSTDGIVCAPNFSADQSYLKQIDEHVQRAAEMDMLSSGRALRAGHKNNPTIQSQFVSSKSARFRPIRRKHPLADAIFTPSPLPTVHIPPVLLPSSSADLRREDMSLHGSGVSQSEIKKNDGPLSLSDAFMIPEERSSGHTTIVPELDEEKSRERPFSSLSAEARSLASSLPREMSRSVFDIEKDSHEFGRDGTFVVASISRPSSSRSFRSGSQHSLPFRVPSPSLSQSSLPISAESGRIQAVPVPLSFRKQSSNHALESSPSHMNVTPSAFFDPDEDHNLYDFDLLQNAADSTTNDILSSSQRASTSESESRNRRPHSVTPFLPRGSRVSSAAFSSALTPGMIVSYSARLPVDRSPLTSARELGFERRSVSQASIHIESPSALDTVEVPLPPSFCHSARLASQKETGSFDDIPAISFERTESPTRQHSRHSIVHNHLSRRRKERNRIRSNVSPSQVEAVQSRIESLVEVLNATNGDFSQSREDLITATVSFDSEKKQSAADGNGTRSSKSLQNPPHILLSENISHPVDGIRLKRPLPEVVDEKDRVEDLSNLLQISSSQTERRSKKIVRFPSQKKAPLRNSLPSPTVEPSPVQQSDRSRSLSPRTTLIEKLNAYIERERIEAENDTNVKSKQYRHYQLLQVEELHRRLMNGEILSDIEIQWLEHRCTQNLSSNSTVFASIDSSHEKGQMVRSALSSSLHSMLECSASDSHATKRGSSWRKSDRSIHSKVVDGWKSSLRHVISSHQYYQASKSQLPSELQVRALYQTYDNEYHLLDEKLTGNVTTLRRVLAAARSFSSCSDVS